MRECSRQNQNLTLPHWERLLICRCIEPALPLKEFPQPYFFEEGNAVCIWQSTTRVDIFSDIAWYQDRILWESQDFLTQSIGGYPFEIQTIDCDASSGRLEDFGQRW